MLFFVEGGLGSRVFWWSTLDPASPLKYFLLSAFHFGVVRLVAQLLLCSISADWQLYLYLAIECGRNSATQQVREVRRPFD